MRKTRSPTISIEFINHKYTQTIKDKIKIPFFVVNYEALWSNIFIASIHYFPIFLPIIGNLRHTTNTDNHRPGTV